MAVDGREPVACPRVALRPRRNRGWQRSGFNPEARASTSEVAWLSEEQLPCVLQREHVAYFGEPLMSDLEHEKGFAKIPAGLVRLAPYLEDRHLRWLIAGLSFGSKLERGFWPSQNTIAKLAGRSRQWANRVAGQLEVLGVIKVTDRFDEKTQERRASLYHLTDLNNDDIYSQVEQRCRHVRLNGFPKVFPTASAEVSGSSGSRSGQQTETEGCRTTTITEAVTPRASQGLSRPSNDTGCHLLSRTAEETRVDTSPRDDEKRQKWAALPPASNSSDLSSDNGLGSSTSIGKVTNTPEHTLADAGRFVMQDYDTGVRAVSSVPFFEEAHREGNEYKAMLLKRQAERLQLEQATAANSSPTLPDTARSRPSTDVGLLPTCVADHGNSSTVPDVRIPSTTMVLPALKPADGHPMTLALPSVENVRKSKNEKRGRVQSRFEAEAANAQARKAATKSVLHMRGYLLFGSEGVQAIESGMSAEQLYAIGLRPSPTNWRQYMALDADGNLKVDDQKMPEGLESWSIPALAGYYWMQVCLYMSCRKLPISHPTDFGRLVGTFKRLAAGSSKYEVFQKAWILVSNFDEIMAVKNKFDELPSELSIDNRLISEACMQWNAMKDYQKDEVRERLEGYRNAA